MTQYVRPPQNKPVLVSDPDARVDAPAEDAFKDEEAEPGKGENAAGFLKRRDQENREQHEAIPPRADGD
jgi:hypothetical protein